MRMSNYVETAWTPDLIGPIFKRDSISLREVLITHRNDKCTRTMATFVPDELIYERDLSKKSFRKFNSVLALFNLTRIFNVYEKYISAENGGSYALFSLLNNYASIIIEEVYTSHGDVLKFSQDAMLVAWKVNRNEFVSKMVYHVVLCAQRIQGGIAAVNNAVPIKLDIVMSAGEITFSVIGDESARRFVVGGTPIEDLKYARRICLPGDLVLSSSAWEHCAPSQYEYVIKDSSNVKIIKVLGPPAESPRRSNGSMEENIWPEKTSVVRTSSELSLLSEVTMDSEVNTVQFQTRVSVIDALRRRLGAFLETYMLKMVLAQITSEQPLKYLTEVRQVTASCVSVIPINYTIYELISLVDQLFKIIHNIAETYSGCISMVNLYERDISFYILYGLRDYIDQVGNENNSKNGILSSFQIMKEVKRVAGVKSVLIGVSTGIAFCGVIGHTVRRQYIVFGTPIDKAISLMMISFDKISCDYDTLLNSGLGKEKFRSRGMQILRRFGKCHVYEYIDKQAPKADALMNLDYSYPILDRVYELEYFKDILDDIGVPGRVYSGLLIEGSERSGKSRILDAFVRIVRNRQIKLVHLSLHPSHTDKAYAVLYHIFLQLFDAEGCTTIEDRERVLLNTLSEILKFEHFCYLNTIMRVQFPLSEKYCVDTDWKRHKKTIEIFEVILNEVVGRVCILLDDVQYMDLLSWQFLSSAMNNHNVVIVMTMMEPISWDNLTQVEAGICQDKRLMNRTLEGLDPKYLAAFACQFFNVIAIPKGLEKILQRRSNNMIGWCEAFLMSALQVQAVEIVTISPMDASRHDLVFPDQSLLAKIPEYLTPEELAPPLHWTQMSALNVCIPYDKPRGFVESNRDVTGLRIDIYNRMNSYEQDFIKCAAALGDIFLRNMVDNVMANSAPVYTMKAVAEMIRLRILECAMIQRKHCHSDNSVFYVLKKRKTFSNKHHLVTCDCLPSHIFARKLLPPYAYCKVLEFTISSYRKLFYEILSPHEKKDYHTKAVGIYERNARKCNTCGGGKFLNLITKEETEASIESLPKLSLTMQRRGTFVSRHDRYEPRRSIFAPDSNHSDRRRESVNIRRISILPVHTDADSEDHSDLSPGYSKEGSSIKKTANGADAVVDDPWVDRLKQFTYVDYRNCRCMEVLSYIFWKLHHHIVHSKDPDTLIKFMMEYSAGLIQTAQPLYATKFLSATTASINILKVREKVITDSPDAIINKGRSLVLMGDAYVAYGNYSQAKKFYTEAATLRTEIPQTSKAICYNIMLEEMRYKVRGLPENGANEEDDDASHHKMELAVYLHRYSKISTGEFKVAKLTILQSLRAAFESAASFLEKGKIYLTAVEVFQRSEKLHMIRPLEKPILRSIERKTTWKNPEEVVIVARVYQTMYENSILQGKLSEGIEIGIKICKICNYLHLNKIKLAILPSLIEVLVWTKQVNEAVDLIYELYYLAKEDTDYSAITWYYALCMELLLDAAMILETYDNCYDFYDNVISFRSSTCVLRDPESLSRLTTCLVIWQLRMNIIVTDTFVKDVEEYTEHVTYDKFSQIYNCIKGLESYLLILKRRINIKRPNDLFDRVQNANSTIKFLHETSNDTPFVKPFLYMLQAYMDLLRGRKTGCQSNIVKASKAATHQGNKLIIAWAEQNKRTWEEDSYNNMAQYWVEHVGNGDGVRWQEIHTFSTNAWSTILFPFPIPDSNF